MKKRKYELNSETVKWLLEEDNLSVRFFTLTNLLEKPLTSPDVIATQKEIMTEGVVPKILASQNEGGYWGIHRDFYLRCKYNGTVWNIILLSQLGVKSDDPKIRRAVEFILAHSQDPIEGGFSVSEQPGGGGNPASVIPCLTGNMLWSSMKFGLLDDPRVQKGIDWINTYQRFDDGDTNPPKKVVYRHNNCWGKHTCMMGVVKNLKALAEIPKVNRTKATKQTIERGAEFLLMHRLYKHSHDASQVAKKQWMQFGFPLMWNTDALEMLDTLTKLGYHDARMQDAVDLLLSKQDTQGRWHLENTYNGRSIVRIENLGKPSKWVTLRALTVLKRCG